MRVSDGMSRSRKSLRVAAAAVWLLAASLWMAVGADVAQGQGPPWPALNETSTATPGEGWQPPGLELGPGRNPLERVEVFIRFNIWPGQSERSLVRAAGGRVTHRYSRLVRAFAAEIPLAAVTLLERLPSVTAIEPVGRVYAVDWELDNSWGVNHIGSALVHAGGNKGEGVKVAIIDSGIDYTHPDLFGNYAGGWDFVNNDDDPMDDYGHGMHVAGIVAAEDDVFGVVGVAPKAEIYALKVLDFTGGGSYADIIAALEWAMDPNNDNNTSDHLHVTNNSYGSSGDPGLTVKAAFDNAASAGVLHIAAAGNSGNLPGRGDNVIYPARWDSLVAVAATDNGDKRASFSSTGPDVEIAAPGVDVLSTYVGGDYASGSGTSMACPHVAGTAALIIASGITDPGQVRERLQTTADSLGNANWYGYGLVDADEAGDAGDNTDPPLVTILSPAGGSTFEWDELIKLESDVDDPEEGDLSTNTFWISSIAGTVAPGVNPFYTYLPEGVQEITAYVTDAGGLTGWGETITITVGSPASNTPTNTPTATATPTNTPTPTDRPTPTETPTPPSTPTLQVDVSTDNSSYQNRQTVYITVNVTDGTDAVGGAAVRVEITTAKGKTVTRDGTTDANGIATVKYKVNSRKDGTGTYTVNANANKDGYESGSDSTTFEVTG